MHDILVGFDIGLILPTSVSRLLLGSHQQYLIPLLFLLGESLLSLEDSRRQIMELQVMNIH